MSIQSVNEALIDLAVKKDVDLDYITYDLNDTVGIDEIMSEIMTALEEEDLEAVFLVNNAGILQPVKPAEKCQIDELKRSINVNLLAPMVLTSEFIKHAKTWPCMKRIINISSGAANRGGVYGWSAYCTTKAGLDMFTQTVGIEQDIADNNIKVMAIAPGIIDTKMQEEIRSSTEEDFMEVERFIGFKEEGNLSAPEDVASKLLQVMKDDLFAQGGAILDIREL